MAKQTKAGAVPVVGPGTEAVVADLEKALTVSLPGKTGVEVVALCRRTKRGQMAKIILPSNAHRRPIELYIDSPPFKRRACRFEKDIIWPPVWPPTGGGNYEVHVIISHKEPGSRGWEESKFEVIDQGTDARTRVVASDECVVIFSWK